MQDFQIPAFDNRFTLGKGRRHLTLTLGGKRILYAYIRKNGCSCFKSVIGGDPDMPVSALPSEARSGYFRHYDAKIFVWRDPEERLISLYRNKILERRNADDLVSRYWQVMGEPPSTFERFAVFAMTDADPHLVPQRQHLRRIRYTHAIELRSLHKSMVRLVGPDAAEPFRETFNASLPAPVHVTPYARALIHRHYACDYAMIERIMASGGSAADRGEPFLVLEPLPAPTFTRVEMLADEFRFGSSVVRLDAYRP